MVGIAIVVGEGEGVWVCGCAYLVNAAVPLRSPNEKVIVPVVELGKVLCSVGIICELELELGAVEIAVDCLLTEHAQRDVRQLDINDAMRDGAGFATRAHSFADAR